MASSALLTVRGVEYGVGLTADGEALRVDLQDTQTGELWSGTFNTRYVEGITQKTGSFKKFGVFVGMLRSALAAPAGDETLKLDVLTYADLQVLKQRKAAVGDPSFSAPAPPAAASSTKRYLILTYASQFDRVHFPLPLSFLHTTPHPPTEAPPPQPRAVAWSAPAVDLASAGAHGLQQRCEQLSREKAEALAAYDTLHRESAREMDRLRRQAEALSRELEQQAEQARGLEAQLAASRSNGATIDRLRAKLERQEEAHASHVRDLEATAAKQKKELILVNAELSRSRREEERLRRHLRQTEAEAKMAQRRSAAANGVTTTRPSSREDGYRAGSAAGSRAASAAVSRPASRAGSAERSRDPRFPSYSRHASQPSSRASSVSSSRASPNRSREAARPAWNSGAGARLRPYSPVAPRSYSPVPGDGWRVASRTASHQPSCVASYHGSRDGSRNPSRDGSRAASAAPSRHASAYPSAHASRAPSAHDSRACSRASSRASSRAHSAPHSRDHSDTGAGSSGASSRASSRTGSAERTRPPRPGGPRHPPVGSTRSTRLPSLELAARQALVQTLRSSRRTDDTHHRPRVPVAFDSSEEEGGRGYAKGPRLTGASGAASRAGSGAHETEEQHKGAHDASNVKENQRQRGPTGDDRGLAARELRDLGVSGAAPVAGAGGDPTQDGPHEEALRDMTDIDRRLNALQDFLRGAKIPC